MSSPWGSGAWWRVVLIALAWSVAHCGGDDPADGGAPPADVPASDTLAAPDTGASDAAADVPEGGGPDTLLCEAACARQERARCGGFVPDGCPARCVAELATAPSRCRSEVEAVLRCRASFAEYTCDRRGLPATVDCDAEDRALRTCAGSPPDAGPEDVPDAPPPTDLGPGDVPAPDDVTADTGAVVVMDVPDDLATDVPADASGAGDAADGAGPDASPDATGGDARPPESCPAFSAAVTAPGADFSREDTTSGASGVPATRCQPEADGPEHAYDLTVTARTGVVIDTEGAAFDTVLSVRRACDDGRTEVACDDDGGRDRTSSVRAVLDAGRYAVLVDGVGGARGRYVLRVRSFTPAANATCAGARALAPGATLAAQDARAGGLRDAACRPAGGAVLFYTVVVPAASRVTVRATPTGPAPWTATLAAADSCAARACVARSEGETPGATTALVLANPGAAARTFVVSVATATTADGTFDLAASAAVGLPRGATCEAAVALTPGTGLTGQDAATAVLSAAGYCRPEVAGPALFYAVRVPARQRLTARATPTGATPWAPTVRALRSCAVAACAASATASGPGSAATLSLDNDEDLPLDLVVAVSGAAPGGAGTFDLLATLGPIPPGASCAAPETLTAGTPIAANTLTGLRSGAALCEPTATGPQLFYALRIPAGERATVVATPSGAAPWRPTLRALSSCASSTCLQHATADGVGAPAILVVENPSAAARDVVITVAGAAVPAGGAFELAAAITPVEPTPYALTTAPVACDALAPAAAVAPLDGWSDDAATDLAPLPFPLRFFGAAVTHWSASSNGFAQLWTSATPEPSVASVNAPVPNAAPPNGLVAPFWDDLVPVDPVITEVRAATLGTSPSRRFVIEWRGWQVLGDAATRLTFQAKLFEGTGVIELHYCSLAPSRASVFGSGATIGIEDVAGARGVEVAHNRLGAINPANAFRLTPR